MYWVLEILFEGAHSLIFIMVLLVNRRPNRTASQNDRDWKAWLVVLGSFLWTALSHGQLQVHGLLLEEISARHPAISQESLPWISGMASFLALSSSYVFSSIVDVIGPFWPSVVAMIMTIATPSLLADCYEFSGFLLCMGIWNGLAIGLCLSVGPSLPGKLFDKHLSFAQSTAMAGSSLAGVLYSQGFHFLFNGRSWEDSMRIFKYPITAMAVLAFSCTLIYSRVVPRAAVVAHGKRRATLKSVFRFKARPISKPSPYFFFAIGMFSLEFAIFGMGTTLPSIAKTAGYSVAESRNTMSVLSGSALLGRISLGYVADRIGCFETILLSIPVELILVGGLSMHFIEHDIGYMYGSAVAWGILSSCWMSLLPACLGKLCDVKQLGSYYGFTNLLMSPACLITTPAMSAILAAGGTKATHGTIIGTVAIGGIFILTAWVKQKRAACESQSER